MTTREEAQRLADALEKIFPDPNEDHDPGALTRAAALLRQWPEEPRRLLEQALDALGKVTQFAEHGILASHATRKQVRSAINAARDLEVARVVMEAAAKETHGYFNMNIAAAAIRALKVSHE